jgi:hypothetical protein
VCGQRGDQSHAWLEKANTIVDITADQFDGSTLPPVYVGPKTEFHNEFVIEFRHPGHFRVYDEHTRAILGSAYELIRRHVLGTTNE